VGGRLADDSNREDQESMVPVPDRTTAAVLHEAAPQAIGAPVALRSAGTWWLVAAALFSLLVYYFVGVDQGALSVLGNDMHIHEFAHDGRHVLAFPCH
jgi:Probable cobalt transporter subunit (CbtB)